MVSKEEEWLLKAAAKETFGGDKFSPSSDIFFFSFVFFSFWHWSSFLSSSH